MTLRRFLLLCLFLVVLPAAAAEVIQVGNRLYILLTAEEALDRAMEAEWMSVQIKMLEREKSSLEVEVAHLRRELNAMRAQKWHEYTMVGSL